MSITPSTSATAAAILSALMSFQNNAAYDALTDTEKEEALDAALSPIGDFKTVLMAGNWWETFLGWLRELIDSLEDIWDDIIDRIAGELDLISGLPWYWMPLPALPIPPVGV
jgi:hypothetical protein